MGEEQRAERAEQRKLTQLESELTDLRSHFIQQLGLVSDTILEHSTVLDRMAEGHGRGANVPLVPFHGNRNEDFSQYIKQFELICDANNYAAEKRAQILASYLRDKAFFIFDALPAATKTDYTALKQALTEKFHTADYRRYAHQKFQERKQQPTETVPDYACDVHRLGLAALADVNADQRDVLIREKFIVGLLPHLRELIVYSNPASFHEAMTLAERLEGLQAGKTDNNAKHVLLLESISDRLASLETHTKKLNHDSEQSDFAYVMEAPRRNGGDGFAIQRKFQLGNFRPEFRPSGMVCFRCNRTGHMARNCTRVQNMNAVMCRLCNRMGHYARHCQRRSIGPSRRDGPSRDNIPSAVGRPQPPVNAGRPNRTMVMATQDKDEEETAVKRVEYVRWQPLSAAMWIVGSDAEDEEQESDTTEIGRSDETSNSTDKLMIKECRIETLTWRDNTEEVLEVAVVDDTDCVVAQSTGLNPVTVESTLPDPVTVVPMNDDDIPTPTHMNEVRTVMKRGGRASKNCMVCLFCWWLIIATSMTGVVKGDASYRQSEPMLCQAVDGRALWKLPTTFNCPKGNHSLARAVVPMKFRLYKRNYIQYKSDAWKCVRVTEEVKTFTYFFGDENLKKAKKYAEPVSAEECLSMKHYKTCLNQPMIIQGGIYQTNNKLNWYYPGGGINCCHWKLNKITNCFMYQAHVHKRHGTSEMEATAGDVSNCKYRSGQCVLSDGSFLLWNVNNRSFCELLPWKELSGKMSGMSWLSDDSNLALTFTRDRRTADCQGKPLLLSDQGIPVKPLILQTALRHKRQLTPTDLRKLREVVSKDGVVSSAQLAASLQALETRWGQNMEFAFSHALNNVCNFMRSEIELLKTQVLANPTMAIRALTNQSEIFARSGGNVIEVFPCTQLNKHHYRFKPMNGSCTVQLLIKFMIHNKTNHGYLDPVTNIIHRYAIPTDCNLVKQVPVQLKDKIYVYHANSGDVIPAHGITELKVMQWNIEPVIDMKATIFHEIVIYNWEELQTHISLNDIIGGLDRQRAILRHIGITDGTGDPQKVAQGAVSHIMDLGYFGFLHGLTANFFQVWTLLVCLYVTICIVIVHCIPIQAIPAALNAGNAARRLRNIYHNWRQQRPPPPPNNIPESAPLMVVDPESAELNRLATSWLERINRRYPKAIMPPTEMEMIAPNAPYSEEDNRDTNLTTFAKETTEKPTIDIQPFRVNVMYPLSETAIEVMVEGIVVECLIDTGASHTLISIRLVKLLGLTQTSATECLRSITGQEIPVTGQVTVTAK